MTLAILESGSGTRGATSRGAALTGVVPDVLFEDLCFDAQQAAEKALKAVLISGGRRFPKTHDLTELLHLG